MFVYLEQFDIPEEKFHPLYADGASFIIGQEQDGFPYGGRFDADRRKVANSMGRGIRNIWNNRLFSFLVDDRP